MNTSFKSKVENYFLKKDLLYEDNVSLRKTPVIIVDNYVELGQLTALRFLEWVCHNPGGVIALPTGKTPEFFIQWVKYYLSNWDREIDSGMLKRIGFDRNLRPDMASLHFFQLDEFFPMDPEHERSFAYFVNEYYIKGFGLDPGKANLITTKFLLNPPGRSSQNKKDLSEVFPNGKIDLGLRFKKPSTESELLKQTAIRQYDQFCLDYEKKIREAGGIGFFLGGIGPDGHVAFNVRGSSHYSHTRLTSINYETQAAAAGDLGGIELVRKKAVITIGLETITFNPDCVAIIIAAGESKAGIVSDGVEKPVSLEYPSTALRKLHHAKFFITQSASVKLSLANKSIKKLYKNDFFTGDYVQKLIIEGATGSKNSLGAIRNKSVPGKESLPKLKLASELTNNEIEILAEKTWKQISKKIENGIAIPKNQRILHTAPHHDDIELAYFPYLHHLVRSPVNENHFCYCTSGFTAVTNMYLIQSLEKLRDMIVFQDSFSFEKFLKCSALRYAQDDITGYLNALAGQENDARELNLSKRLLRLIMKHTGMQDKEKITSFIDEILHDLRTTEPGRKEKEIIYLMKGWLREFEAELVWAHFGIDTDHVNHLRLHFYSDKIFPEYPDYDLDVVPILELFEKIQPTIITLALDPEGSGPDTHYKTLIAIAEAIDKYVENHPDMNVRIWGYRNVWSRWDISDINMIIPISLNSFAVLHNMFNSCFLSQKSASFPSYELDGTFSHLAQKIWVEQHQDLLLLLGKEYFYNSPNPLLRRSYGAIYLKDMNYSEFKAWMVPVRKLLSAKSELTKNKN